MSTLDFNLPIDTKLTDLDFAIRYKLLQKGIIKSTELSAAIKHNVVSMINRASKSSHGCHDGVIRFYLRFKTPLLNNKTHPKRPFSALLSQFISDYQKFENFLKYCGSNPATCGWTASFIPNYFMEHQLDGIKTDLLTNDFDSFAPTEPTLAFSTTNIIDNTMLAGYLTGSITIRIVCPRYDKKHLNSVLKIFQLFCLNHSSPKKVTLINNMQHFELEILPTVNDLEIQTKSELAKSDFIELYKAQANGKKYIFTLEDSPISEKGFKSLEDVQSFLNLIENSIRAVDSSQQHYLYMKSMMPLVGITNKGTAVSLKKFRFNYVN